MAINNPAVFNAAFVGAFAGMVHNVPPSTVSADYTAYTNEANAFAIELDSLVAPIPGGPTVAQADLYESLSYDFFAFIEAPAGSTTPTDYAHAAAVVLAEFTSAVTKPVSTNAPVGIQFVFRPNEPDPSGNVYASWAALVADAAVVAAPKTVIFDDSLAACVIPVGAWDLGKGCTFRGLLPAINSPSGNRVQVSCANGVTLAQLLYELRDIQLTYSGVGALMTSPTGNQIFYMSSNARTNSTGAGGRIFDIASGSAFVTHIREIATIVVAGGGFFYNALAGAVAAQIRAYDSALVPLTRVPSNSLAGVAGPTYDCSEDFLGVISTTQTSLPGATMTLVTNSNAPQLPYAPAVPAQWVAPAPTTVKAALDRLAAVVSVGGATPIP